MTTVPALSCHLQLLTLVPAIWLSQPGRGGGKVEEDSLYWGVILLPRPVSGCVNKHMSVTSVATEQKPEVF